MKADPVLMKSYLKHCKQRQQQQQGQPQPAGQSGHDSSANQPKPIMQSLQKLVIDIIIALMIERKSKISAINPKEYYCKPSVLHILIILANIIFSTAFFVPQVFSDSVDAIFITIWYYCGKPLLY